MTNNCKGRGCSTYLLVEFLAKIATSLAGEAVLGGTSRFKIEIDDSLKTLPLILARFSVMKLFNEYLWCTGCTITIILTLILLLPLQKNSFLV